MRYRSIFTLLLWCFALSFELRTVHAQTPDPIVSSRLDVSALAPLIATPTLQAFDLSPDGEIVAMLVVSGYKTNAPLWLVTEDIATKRVISSRHFGNSIFPSGGFAPQVLWTPDQKYLAVQDLQSVSIIDAATLELIRSIGSPMPEAELQPLFIIGASKKDIVVCAFGKRQDFTLDYHEVPVENVIVDMSNGDVLGDWKSVDVPQAISPEGRMIAVSSSEARQGVVPLDVFDLKGNRVANLDGGYAFPKWHNGSKPFGRVLGSFIDEMNILLSPDENVDNAGHHSGDSLRIVNIRDHVMLQSITPKDYAGTSEMVVSRNQGAVLAVTWYLPPNIYRHAHEPLPADSTPKLILLEKKENWYLNGSFPISAMGFKVSGWLENRRPRLSSDGSVIAIAQDNGITILSKSLVSKSH